MGRLGTIVASAVLAVLGEIAISISASSVAFPKKYSYLILTCAFVVAVGLAAVSDSKRDRKSKVAGRIRSNSSNTANEKIHVLQGTRRQQRPGGQQGAGYALLFVGYCAFFGGIIWTAGSGKVHSNLDAGIPLTCVSIIVFVYGIYLVRGVRVNLAFSSEGITRIDASGRHLIRWDEASDFHTMKPFLISEYLVAEPVSGSEYFLGPWGFDRSNNLIRICNLTECGIGRSDVDGALTYWHMYTLPVSAARIRAQPHSLETV